MVVINVLKVCHVVNFFVKFGKVIPSTCIMKMRFSCLVLLFIQLMVSINASSEQYEILYINSYHTGYSWTDDVTNG